MSADPEEAGVDWGYTGYGTGDPNATGFLSKLGEFMPLIVAGIFTAGTLQSMGLLPGMSADEAAAADSAIAGGDIGGAATTVAPGVIANSAPDIGALTAPPLAGAATTAAAGGADAAAKAAADAAKTKALAGMGLSPGQITSLLAILGGDAISGITAPRPQYRQSFAGTAMDPTKLGGSIKDALTSYLGETEDRAHAGTNIDTTVNPLPSFVGGGLPMTIAAPGMDARRLQRRSLSPDTASITRDPNAPPGVKIPVPTSPQSNEFAQTDGQQVNGGSGGDADQALAALQLIMRKQTNG